MKANNKPVFRICEAIFSFSAHGEGFAFARHRSRDDGVSE
jgi:hypothetical protein